ncbi:centrosomal protein of 97 kDa isoform X1 [Lucilia cuprina]|uniref:centrosomal protein of 97 kDa isoform X1 n=2 Tax=Lucilia cuprina TaxID=7375 RepID=UPI001F06D9F4|nr:centrosomal protein of 97 kDa isoform X1 [Lucilia cuprina]
MSEEENEKIILDLSRKQLKKVPKQEDAQNVRTLLLDENELQKIDNIDSYLKIEKLSLSKNQLLRMYGVCRLHCLRDLNLSFNGILSIEGLKECVHLRYLNLEGNNIKTIEHLNTNIKLEFLNLAENSIGSISDISFLKNLKELYLHGNRLTHLRQCDKYLPTSLEALTLAKNNISDLNEICSLTNLINLNSLTINENPCVSMTAGPDGFDHRPFVLNWCLTLKIIDGFVVDPIESLKAEWLYSQGRGRSFRLGEQAALAKYLSSVCPLIGKALENENERKLRLILSKAQHHQRQLQEEISENSNPSANNSPSSGRKKPASRIQSPRFSRLSGRQGSPDSMVNSYHGNTTNEQVANANHLVQMTTSLIENIKNCDTLMSQSLEGSNVNSSNSKMNNSQDSTPRTITPNPYNGGPLNAASKMVPVPETLMSPDVCPAAVAQRVTVSAINTQIQQTKINKNKDNRLNSPKMRSPHLKRNTTERSPTMSPRKTNSHTNTTNTAQHQHTNQKNVGNQQHALHMDHQMKSRQFISNSMLVAAPDDCSGGGSSDDDSDHINVDKLKTIRNKAAQRCQQLKQNMENSSHNLSPDTENSAVVIQKIWRGYRTRKKTKDIAEKLLKKRTHEYIDKLTKDMEMTKAQLENERKIQQLQMQAINALWKKVSSMQNTTATNTNTTIDSQNIENTSSTTSIGNQQNQNTLSLDNSSTTVVNDLAKTCTMLTNQVQQLQGSMRDILNCLTLFCNLPQENVKRLLTAGVAEALSTTPHNAAHVINSATTTNVTTSQVEKRDSAATQTEIVAVHTPQLENQSHFPFTKIRPSTLPLIESQNPNTPSNSNNVATTATDTDNTTTETPTNKRPSLEESGIASTEDVRSSNDSVSIVEKQDEDEKHNLNLTTTISG